MDRRAKDSYKKILDTVNNLIRNSRSNINKFSYEILDDGEITIRLQVEGQHKPSYQTIGVSDFVDRRAINDFALERAASAKRTLGINFEDCSPLLSQWIEVRRQAAKQLNVCKPEDEETVMQLIDHANKHIKMILGIPN